MCVLSIVGKITAAEIYISMLFLLYAKDKSTKDAAAAAAAVKKKSSLFKNSCFPRPEKVNIY